MPDVGQSANSNDKCLLIVAFVQGNNFPKRTQNKFVIEAKFDGETLSTDPVEHNETIEINQELAWEIDKKNLQFHKLQRSCIKANCFALNEVTHAKELIGYIVLHVRSAPDGIQISKEMNLLQTKYQKEKPSLQCMIYIEGDQKSASSAASGAIKSSRPSSALSGSFDEEETRNNELLGTKHQVKAVFDDKHGYFRIGKNNSSQQNYILTITLVFVRNLIKIIPQTATSSASSKFFFAFKFFNNQFTSKPFCDIVSGEMNVEKCSIRLFTSLSDLKMYLSNDGPLEILLCSGNKILAKTSLNWESFFSSLKDKDSLPVDSPIIVDHILNLESNEKNANSGIVSPSSETAPVLGVQCILEHEKLIGTSKKLNNQNEDEKCLNEEGFNENSPNFVEQGEVIYQSDSTTIKIENNPRKPSPETVVLSSRRQPNVDEHFINYFTEEMQLKAAYEFQIWKEHREKEFEAQLKLNLEKLKKLEAKRFQALADAFKQHDVERETIIQKKIKEYNDLEVLLKNSLSEVEKREKQLAFNETQISRLKADLHREYETKLLELREASKRVQEKADHQLNLQKSKTDSLEEEISKYRRQVLELEKRISDKDVEFTRYKERDQNRPEIKLQSEINILKLEKIELERKLDAQTKAKIHYKEQFMKTLQELSILKKREEANARILLKKQQKELDHLKKRYLADDESEFTSGTIRKVDEPQTMESNIKPDKKSSEYNFETIDPILRQRINRLKEERECLMRTGAYSSTDAIIIELDRRIYDCIREAKVI